jgi:Kef-type K+ transport system membrane component KefB
MEFDFDHVGRNRRAAISISASGVLLPLALGLGLGFYLHKELLLEGNRLHFALFMAVAMSITAIPILGRIMIELNMNRTKLGSLVISAAAVDDACGWILLAAVTAISRAAFSPLNLGAMILWLLAYVGGMFWCVRPLLKRWLARRLLKSHGDCSPDTLAVILVLLFLSAALTNLIGIFSIFGAFVFGALLYDEREFAAAIRKKLNDFVTVFFLPIFFTYTGLRTDIGSMDGASLWTACGMVLSVAIVGKLVGTGIAAWVHGLSFRDSAMVGVMMNTRALMELIVINVGYDLGIIPRSVFFMLVFMAVFTTYMTAPLLRLLAVPAQPGVSDSVSHPR